MNPSQAKFHLNNTVKVLTPGQPPSESNYRVITIRGHWFGTCTYDVQSIASTTALEHVIKNVPENFLLLVPTVSV
jgi:hypothetical protein